MAKLSTAADEALSRESRFLGGVQANIEGCKGRHLRGDFWETVADDEGDALRALMASKRMYDRALLARLPHNRRVTVKGFETRFFFWRKQTGAAVASVLTPLAELLDGAETLPPVGANELAAHLRKVAADARLRQVVGVCAPSGFTEQARGLVPENPNVTLVLVEPGDDGGWRITAGADVPAFVRQMFDPEDAAQKVARVRREVERRSSELLTGGLSAESLARAMHLPRETVEAALVRIVAEDPELRLSKSSGDRLLYRGAPAFTKEKASMSFVERIKELFAREGDEVSKINVLSERRAALAQRRDRLYEEIGRLEEREAEMLAQGRENKSAIVRRRLAAQVAQLRKDIARQNTTASMLNQQINIIATDIHNLTLIQQGQMAALPDAQELTENAVRAEEMLETLKADADLVSGLETGIGDVLTSDEERDILAEFEAPPEGEGAAGEDASASRSEKTTRAPAQRTAEDNIAAEFDEPPSDRSKAKKADPEAT